MKITAINFSGAIQNLLSNAIGGIDGSDLSFIPITSADNSIGKEELIIFFWEGDTNLGVKYIEDFRKGLSFSDIPIVLVSNKKPDLIEKALKSGASSSWTLPLDEENIKNSIEKIMKPAGANKSVNVEFVNPFLDSTSEVMRTMAKIKEVNRKGLYLKKDYKMFGEISGVMGLSGAATGSVAIALTTALAKKLVAGMLGMNPEEMTPEDVHDGVGEIINMIAGKAKSILSDTEYKFVISLPTIVSGAGHEIMHKTGTPCIVVVMTADGEEFALQISLAPKSE